VPGVWRGADLITPQLSVALGIAFLYAAIAKVRNVDAVRLALAGFGVTRTSATAVLVLIGYEMSLGVLLLLPLRTATLAGLGLATTTLALFAVLQLRVLSTPRRFPCACFGGAETLSITTLLRTLVLLAIAIAGLIDVLAGGLQTRPDLLPAYLEGIAFLVTVLAGLEIAKLRLSRQRPGGVQEPASNMASP
jgi:uncharacterized membrane protein YphA (DoxX/SURF4 family)